jgi:magnesium chelatase family protein
MRVQSFIRQRNGISADLIAVEIELSLQPGLPQIHFLGLPDAALKESALRIRSAIRSQGFRMPQGSQVLVHLRPSHLRKSSRGIDLAVAAALLWEMRQIPPLPLDSIPIVYGSLTLGGEVEIPDDADEIAIENGALVITGRSISSNQSSVAALELPYASWRLTRLRDLEGSPEVSAAHTEFRIQRPLTPVERYPLAVARIAEVVAAGEHSLLVAGPPGSGKSTLVNSIASWIEAPSPLACRRFAKPGSDGAWRPVVRPHHSITPLAMIGGGGQLWSGEISRAHSGVLLMDELLEFHAEIQESLREPMETGAITITRSGHSKTFPSRFLTLATTNLCECGQYVPGARAGNNCRCTRAQRRRSMARLTGPFADRFAILAYSDGWLAANGSERTAYEIGNRVARAIEFRSLSRGQAVANSFAKPAEIEATLTGFQQVMVHDAFADGSSLRRRDSVLRLARTLADLRQSALISHLDLDEALSLGLHGHQRLKEWRE